MNVLALIMTDGRDSRLGVLAQDRSEAAVPFAGKYRVIDFALSNCANSGILDIGVLTQYQPRSLNDHIRTGRPWDLERKLSGGVTLLPPYLRDGSFLGWYRGTADAIYQNLDFVLRHKADAVLVLPGDHISKMDYTPFVRYHQQQQAGVTICAIDAPLEEPFPLNTLITDDEGRVIEFQKSLNSPHALASTGVYVFRTDVLIQYLTQNARLFGSTHDLDNDVLPCLLESGDQIYAYHFQGYSVNVGTVQAYWKANIDLLSPDSPLDLRDRRWSINTRNENRPPVNVCPGGAVSNSLITDGCVIAGQVERSVLSPGVQVRAGAVVRDSVVFNDCEIGPGAIVERAILDKNVVVGGEVRIGLSLDHASYHSCSNGARSGITLVGRNTQLPAGLRVGCGCVICGDLAADGFASDVIGNDQYVGTQPAGVALESELDAQGPRNGRQRLKKSR